MPNFVKILKLYFLLFIGIVSSDTTLGQNFDLQKCQSILNKKVQVYSEDFKGGVWVIAGENGESLFRITKDGKVKNFNLKANLPSTYRYSDLLCMDENTLILATQQNYLIYLKNKKWSTIDQNDGLTDSLITELVWNAQKRQITVKTKSSFFISSDLSYKKYIKVNIQADSVVYKLSSFDSYIKEPVQKTICNIAADVDLSFRREKMVTKKEVKKN